MFVIIFKMLRIIMLMTVLIRAQIDAALLYNLSLLKEYQTRSAELLELLMEFFDNDNNSDIVSM